MDYELGKVSHRSHNASVTAAAGSHPSLHPSVFLGCGARIIGQVDIGEHCSIWFNAVVRGDVNRITIQSGTNIQDGAVIHGTYEKHSTWIGSHVSIGHQASIHGCLIEEGCLVGMQAVVLDGARIGARSLIGAGAVITPNTIIPPESLVLGSPGKVVRALHPEEIENILKTTKRYYTTYVKYYNFNSSPTAPHLWKDSI